MASWQDIERNPKFIELVQARKTLGWTLSILTLAIYLAYILIIAFDPSIFGARMGDSVMTVGLPVGLFVIVITFLIVGYYVQKANATYDELTRQIVEESK
ncbi:MAG: DUF485 domain-containing protein [Hyphomicrobiales bacterium]|nr:DUF485 domain-containing protein [Hyphomicrobiales bacterium]